MSPTVKDVIKRMYPGTPVEIAGIGPLAASLDEDPTQPRQDGNYIRWAGACETVPEKYLGLEVGYLLGDGSVNMGLRIECPDIGE